MSSVSWYLLHLYCEIVSQSYTMSLQLLFPRNLQRNYIVVLVTRLKLDERLSILESLVITVNVLQLVEDALSNKK